MALAIPHPHMPHIHFSTNIQARLSAGRELMTKLWARTALTPEQRTERYISQMPIAVITASLGGHPSGSANVHRLS